MLRVAAVLLAAAHTAAALEGCPADGAEGCLHAGGLFSSAADAVDSNVLL